jgi:hypothetical protein
MLMRSRKAWKWTCLASVIAVLCILVWRKLVPLSIAGSFLTLLGATLGILTETNRKAEGKPDGKREVTGWGYVLLFVTIAASVVSSTSAHLGNKDSSKKLTDIGDSQRRAEGSQKKAEASQKEAESELKAQTIISQTLALELSAVRHELDLARLPVNRIRLRWDITIPVTTTCLKAYVKEQAGKHANTEYGDLIIKPSKQDFPANCEDELAGLFKQISLNGLLARRGLDVGPDYLDLITDLPKGGVRNDFFSGGVPDEIWPFNVSGTALDSPERAVLYDEKTNLLYLSFETVTEDAVLRTPSGKALSILDASEGTFVFTVALNSYISPYVTVPALRHIRVELNNWFFEFRVRGTSYPEAQPFRREDTSNPYHYYYWGRAPKFKTQFGLPPIPPTSSFRVK